LKVKNVEDAIKLVLWRDGPTTANALYRQATRIFSCSEKTYFVHLKFLLETKAVLKREVGQYSEIYLNVDKKEIFKKIFDLLNEIQLDIKTDYPKIIKFLQSFENPKKYSKISSNDRFKVFDISMSSLEVVLRQSQIMTLLINTSYPSNETKQKAKEIQKIHSRLMKDLFSTMRKIDPSFQIMIFTQLFNDVIKKPMFIQ